MFKSVNFEKDQELNMFMLRINELTALNEKQMLQIAELKDQTESLNLEITKTISSSDISIQAFNQELRILKQELEKSRLREKQVISVFK